MEGTNGLACNRRKVPKSNARMLHWFTLVYTGSELTAYLSCYKGRC